MSARLRQIPASFAGLGEVWACGSDESPLALRGAAILFGPVGALVPAALQAVRTAGVMVCAGIDMSDVPIFPGRLSAGELLVDGGGAAVGVAQEPDPERAGRFGFRCGWKRGERGRGSAMIRGGR